MLLLFSCTLFSSQIILTGLPHIINTESFRPIINPSIALTAKSRRIPIATGAFGVSTTTTTSKPLTTISATLKSRGSIIKQTPIRPPVKGSDSTLTESKDVPRAEALRGDSLYRRRRYPGYSGYGNSYYGGSYSRARRRPNPRPYYTPPKFYAGPYEDYRFETDFLDSNPYVQQSKKRPQTGDDAKDLGVIDTDIGQFYDTSSATFHVGPFKTQESPSYFSSSGTGTSGSGSGAGYDYGADFGEYKYTTTKPRVIYKNTPPKRPSSKPSSTSNKYNSLALDDTDYRYPIEGETSGFGTSAPGDFDDGYSSGDQNQYLGNINSYLSQQQRPSYQTSPKPKFKPKPKPKPLKTTTTYSPPIKISDTSIDVLTKPFGSATFNLNLSPGTVYSPPQISYNPSGQSYRPVSSVPLQSIQPAVQQIPVQPPATSYGVPIAPPLNSYQYSYQNNFAGYPPAQTHNNYVPPSSISITNIPGQFAEPPSLGKQQLSDVDTRYNNVQSSYDATPKVTRPTKTKPRKVNSKRVTPKPTPVVLNTDEELADDENINNDYAGESYLYVKSHNMPQPALPAAYDQDEFHTVGKKQKHKNNGQPSNSFYYERERSTKKPKQVTLRIPDEDYLDDLVKIVQTTKRPVKKKATTHTLDTEDLREAYESDLAYYPKPKRNKNKNRDQYLRQSIGSVDYENDEDDEENEDEEYDTDRISHVLSKEDKSKSTDESSSSSDSKLNTDTGLESKNTAFWDKTSSIYKQYGIRARNDNFHAPSHGIGTRETNGFRPMRSQDRSDVFLANPADEKGNYLHEIGTVAESRRISSTLRTITTPKPTTQRVWDGKELPKNHKML